VVSHAAAVAEAMARQEEAEPRGMVAPKVDLTVVLIKLLKGEKP